MVIFLVSQDTTTIDSVAVDTTALDSIIVYEVPEIISIGRYDKLTLENSLYTIKEYTPKSHDLDLEDVFYLTPFMLHTYGNGQLHTISHRGQDPNHTLVSLNGHSLYNHLFGYFNLTKLPVQFFEKISVVKSMTGLESNAINLCSKINRYDKPYSYLRFTIGDFENNIYNIDFTRPITNDFGFYLSGLYWSYGGYRVNSDLKINSLYTNFYYNQFLPMRLDFLYFSNDYGVPGNMPDTLYGREKDEFMDVSYVCGFGNHKIGLYYNINESNYTDTLTTTSSIKTFGLNSEGCYNQSNVEFIYGITGQLSKIEADVYGSHSINSIGVWARFNKSFKNFILSVSSRNEWISTFEFFNTPKILIGFNVFDSTYLMAAVSRGFRTPSIAETYVSSEIFHPYHKIIGDSTLQPEYYWLQELGIKSQYATFNFYKYNFDNLITTQDGNNGYPQLQNVDSWQTMGLEGYFEIPIYLSRSDDGESTTKFSTGYYGNYLIKGDTLPLTPKGISSLFISLARETDRLSFGLRVKERFVGLRRNMSGQEMNPFRIISVAGTVKFISLSCTLVIDNILDEDYAYLTDYPMAPRSFDVSIKWEFWN